MAVLVVPDVTVQYGEGSYTVDEGGTATVTVELSADPQRTITIPVTATAQDGASPADYATLPTSVTFNAGEVSRTITFTATQDTENDDGESVKLGFGAMPDAWVTEGDTKETTVFIDDDDDPAVTVSFAAGAYNVSESDDTCSTSADERRVAIAVRLSADPERTVTIPIIKTNLGGASDSDYEDLPASVTFNSGETHKTFVFTAVYDAADDEGESVRLAFGTLPPGVTGGAYTETTVSITDDYPGPVEGVNEKLRPPYTSSVSATNEQVTFSWERDRALFYLAGYRICRAEYNLNFELLEEFIPTGHNWWTYGLEPESYTDAGVLPGVRYSYRIYSLDGTDQGKYPATASAVTAATVPGGLRFSTTQSSVTLSWDDPGRRDDHGLPHPAQHRLGQRERPGPPASAPRRPPTWTAGCHPPPRTPTGYRSSGEGQADPASRYVTALTNSRPRASTSVSERRGSDLPASTSTTGLLKVGETVSGTISSTGDRDWFAVDLTAGRDYFLRLRYEGEQTWGHGPLSISCLRDAAGEEIPWPHESCINLSSGVYKAIDTGRHYIEVEHAWDDVPRSYTLEIHEDVGILHSELDHGQAKVGEWTSGSFHDQDFEDTYEMELCGGRRYRMLVYYNADPASDGRLHLPRIRLDHGPQWYFDDEFIKALTIDKPPGAGSGVHVVEIFRQVDEDGRYLDYPEPLSLGEATYRFLVEPVDGGGAQCPSPATGRPAISGTAQVGETLTASASGIEDLDGLTRAVFAYQWLVDDTAVSGATASTYTPDDDDVGKTVRVRVSFTDDAGFQESLTSFATEAVLAAGSAQDSPQNNPATGLPAIGGTPRVGETLTASTSGIEDLDGLTRAVFAYQWLVDDTAVSGATASTYTPADADAGKTVSVRVSFTDDEGYDESLTSEATAAVQARAALAVESAAVDGATLTLTFNGILDVSPGGIPPASAFTVNVGDATRTVSAVSVSGSSVTLTLDPAVSAGDTVTVDYAPPRGNPLLHPGHPGPCGGLLQRAGGHERHRRDRPEDNQQPRHRRARRQRHAPGGRDPHRIHVRHSRRRRSGQGNVRLPVAGRRRGDRRRYKLHLHAGRHGRGQDDQGARVLHRRRGERGVLDQRGDGGRCACPPGGHRIQRARLP